jgi:hypothetical protein
VCVSLIKKQQIIAINSHQQFVIFASTMVCLRMCLFFLFTFAVCLCESETDA